MIRLESIIYRIMVGADTKETAANIPAQPPSLVIATISWYSATLKDIFSVLPAKISAVKYSFHLPINWKITRVVTVEPASGNTIVQDARSGPQPSIAAASS